LFAAITCRPDILYAIIKLFQYNTKPARVRYIGAKQVFHYLCDTIDDGLHYRCTTFNSDLTDLPAPTFKHNTYTVEILKADPNQPIGYVKSNWAGESKHRRSISGMCLYFAGAPVVYRSHFQPKISQSSTEAEFIDTAKAGKLALYLRYMLNDLGINKSHATTLYEDNTAAVTMANASCPTRRTHHMKIKHFSLLDWVSIDLLILFAISTHENPEEILTKSLGPQLYARHTATLLGKRQPSYYDF